MLETFSDFISLFVLFLIPISLVGVLLTTRHKKRKRLFWNVMKNFIGSGNFWTVRKY